MHFRRIAALVGSPNSGKTTLYNWLTQSKYKVVNYPGATVDIAIGNSAPRLGSPEFTVIDTPGIYSLFPKSQDEEITLKILTQPLQNHERVNQVILVADGTQLSRHLSIAKQLQQMNIPFVIVVTMFDLLQKSKLHLNADLISKEFGCPIVLFDGILGQGLEKIGEAIRSQNPSSHSKKIEPWDDETFRQNRSSIHSLVQTAFHDDHEQKVTSVVAKTQRLDRIFLSSIWGLPLFVFIMFALFSSIYTLAAPFQDAIDGFFAFLAELTKNNISIPIFADFIADGIIASFGAVLVFTPQIFILFFGIGLLESSGYLARAATLIDKPFKHLGLSGRSFVPILSGFACAVPAMMATRNLSSAKDRWITNFIIPLMACSARLPVYALLLGFLFVDAPPWKAGLALTALYFGALITGAVVAAILNRIIKQQGQSYFMMELPLYRRPRLGLILNQCVKKTWSYVSRAGSIIFLIAVLIWFGSNLPRSETGEAPDAQHSYLAQSGQWIEPLFEPMGLDWRAGVGLISAFAAREVFVSTLALIYQIEGDEDSQQERLIENMKLATNSHGEKIFTTGSVIGLLLFFMIALQCMSTFAIAVKESGSWKFAVTQLVAFNIIAYILAVLANQIF